MGQRLALSRPVFLKMLQTEVDQLTNKIGDGSLLALCELCESLVLLLVKGKLREMPCHEVSSFLPEELYRMMERNWRLLPHCPHCLTGRPPC
jgi:hypothetical protein